jgi:hypothetical protein
VGEIASKMGFYGYLIVKQANKAFVDIHFMRGGGPINICPLITTLQSFLTINIDTKV